MTVTQLAPEVVMLVMKGMTAVVETKDLMTLMMKK